MAVGLAIVLTGPLLLFNPWLVSAEQARHGVAASLGSDQTGIDRATAGMLGDLFTNGDFSETLDGAEPILDAAERSHMSDVAGLVRVLTALELAAVVVLLIAGWLLRRERERRAQLAMRAALAVGGVALMLGIFFAVAFDTAFASFHALFFQQGTWQFGPDSNLIRLFPEPFWFDVSLLAGVAIVLSAVLAAWLARRDRGSAPAGA